jgi:hypothetical protein
VLAHLAISVNGLALGDLMLLILHTFDDIPIREPW